MIKEGDKNRRKKIVKKRRLEKTVGTRQVCEGKKQAGRKEGKNVSLQIVNEKTSEWRGINSSDKRQAVKERRRRGETGQAGEETRQSRESRPSPEHCFCSGTMLRCAKQPK